MGKKKEKRHLETHYQEAVKRYLIKEYKCATVRELNFGGPKFDVVGFSPDTGEFHIVECKRTSRLVGIGQTFGQILAYKSMIFESGPTFLNSFLKQLAKEGITDVPIFSNVAQFLDAGKIPIRFYVALREKACLTPEFLRLMKLDLKDVGVIRINNYDQCKNYIKVRGKKDYELCKAGTVEVPIGIPPRPALQKLLDKRGSNQDVADVAATIDSAIRKMATQVKAVGEGKYRMAYRVRNNFAVIYPKKEFIRLAVRTGKKWKKTRVSRKVQLEKVMPRIRKAFQQSLSH
jgi:hypothetical protein